MGRQAKRGRLDPGQTRKGGDKKHKNVIGFSRGSNTGPSADSELPKAEIIPLDHRTSMVDSFCEMYIPSKEMPSPTGHHGHEVRAMSRR